MKDMIDDSWTGKELEMLQKLDTPHKIQSFLDGLDYDTGEETLSPKRVLGERRANCFSGALFAAACLKLLGFRPLLVDLRAVNDDDHVVAVFRENGCWGAVAKSNFTTLRFREPVYKSIRELALSYFDFYFNTIGEKTLREFSCPMNLMQFNNWIAADPESADHIGDCLDKACHYKILKPGMEEKLGKVGKNLLEAGLLGAKAEGLFNPKTE